MHGISSVKPADLEEKEKPAEEKPKEDKPAAAKPETLRQSPLNGKR